MDRRQEKEDQAARKSAMAVLARASTQNLRRQLLTSGLPVEAQMIRGPETGLVVLRGRIGGGGSPFNFGEATVTRATAKLPSGEIGHAYALGRDKEKARLSAIIDALWQRPADRERVEAAILAPLRREQASLDERRAAETAATKVDFFTLVRGED